MQNRKNRTGTGFFEGNSSRRTVRTSTTDSGTIAITQNTGRLVQAKTVLQEALTHSPDNPDLLYDLAMLEEQEKHFIEMEKLLRRVISLTPNSQHAYNALGYSFVDRNIHLDEALSLLEKPFLWHHKIHISWIVLDGRNTDWGNYQKPSPS